MDFYLEETSFLSIKKNLESNLAFTGETCQLFGKNLSVKSLGKWSFI